MDDAKKPPAENVWSVAQAKARFSELIERARADDAQTITKNGRAVAVVVCSDDWDKLSRPKQSFYEFLRNSPLVGVELDLERDKSGPRDIDL